MKLLTICPSRSRPKLLKSMIESFLETKSVGTDLVLSFDEDDPSISENTTLAELNNIPYLLNFALTVTQHYNQCYESCGKGYDFFHITNDDVVYKTPNWDLELMGKAVTYEGISYGNDLLQGKNLPTFPVIHSKIVNAVGWVCLPTTTNFCTDMVWKDIGKAIGRIHYVEFVKIEHQHWLNFKRENDNPKYDDIHQADLRAYGVWVATERDRTINKLKQVLNGRT